MFYKQRIWICHHFVLYIFNRLECMTSMARAMAMATAIGVTAAVSVITAILC